MENQFKPFHETYKAVMYSMVFAMVYPNPATDKWRLLAIPLLLLTMLPMSVIALLDSLRCWNEANYLEVLRHIAMFGPFLCGILKMCFMYHRRVEAKAIIDTINEDYASYNYFPENYQTFIRAYIENTKIYHRVWYFCVLLILSAFVMTTTLYNTYEYMFRSEPKRHMIYDIRLPNKAAGVELETPYFEILYMYMLYVALIFYLNFTGYDCFMITAVNHACLRIELFCKHLDDAMEFKGEELRRRMRTAISEQCETFKLIDACQSTFNGNLGMVYLAVTTELCINLFLMTEGYEFDYKFTAFSIGTILHVFVPCRIAEKMKNVCEESSTMIYCCGWEEMYDLSVRRYIPFMLARAQYPATLKAFGILTYDMMLFASTVKTAYSLYTILKRQQT
ncbi:hypothetical protein ABMA28_011581 [Loxostege sticticalis]|uniref:Odorant receptor n=1 Tax=Loxostege sticticalis TaxID=481309 RepID=A0ABD0S6S9_LOXSC